MMERTVLSKVIAFHTFIFEQINTGLYNQSIINRF